VGFSGRLSIPTESAARSAGRAGGREKSIFLALLESRPAKKQPLGKKTANFSSTDSLARVVG
jgi:hypothetical protein